MNDDEKNQWIFSKIFWRILKISWMLQSRDIQIIRKKENNIHVYGKNNKSQIQERSEKKANDEAKTYKRASGNFESTVNRQPARRNVCIDITFYN